MFVNVLNTLNRPIVAVTFMGYIRHLVLHTNTFSMVATANTEPLAHSLFFEDLRNKEYSRLDDGRHVYLDYTGGNLYGISQLNTHHELLAKNVFGNPHSINPTSKFSTKLVEEARDSVIRFFNADDYYCIFTPNASGALKIIGECYPFHQSGCFLLSSDNHNSVNGIREYCRNRGGKFQYTKIRYEDLCLDEVELTINLQSYNDCENKLFAFPAQSNVSGVKHSLNWIEKAHSNGWDVLLDAAAFVPTNSLDLSKYQPDFVSVSFYKIFGYPTGLGCLLVKKEKFNKLQKQWFAGGTVTLASVAAPYHFLANDHERFEDGTVNYLDIPAIKIGLDYINEIGIQRISERVKSCTEYLYNQLQYIKHDNGNPVVKIFGPTDRTQVGGTLLMTFLNASGDTIMFEEVAHKANEHTISLRTGCFCNPGIDEVNNCLTNHELEAYFSGRERGNYYDMIQYLNKMRGAVRISVGIATNQSDLDAFIRFVEGMKVNC